MKTKIIPFNLEMAEKIQAGEIEGKIIRSGAPKQVCEILDFAAEYQDKCSEKFLIVKVPAHDFEKEKLWIYHQDGRAMHSSNYGEMWFDLALEVPDEPQFKPFDKVLVRGHYDKGNNDACWYPALFERIIESSFDDDKGTIYYKVLTDIEIWRECIPYEGNEHLVGTTDKPE